MRIVHHKLLLNLFQIKKVRNSWTKADDENQSEQKNYTTKCEIVVLVVVLKNAPTFLLYYEIYKRIRHTTVHNTFVVEFSLSCGAVLMVDFAAVAWFFIWNSCCKWCNGTLHWKLLFFYRLHTFTVCRKVCMAQLRMTPKNREWDEFSGKTAGCATYELFKFLLWCHGHATNENAQYTESKVQT